MAKPKRNTKTNAKNSAKRKCLKKLVETLRADFRDRKQIDLAEKSSQLAQLGSAFEYKSALYPDFIESEDFAAEYRQLERPRDLAEAFIWKSRNWGKYRDFLEYFDRGTAPKTNYITYWAFAMYLRNPALPIFDQHALRSVWAIYPGRLGHRQVDDLREFLFDGEQWKQFANGPSALRCYAIYISKIDRLLVPGIEMRELDKFLMSLGKALKAFSSTKRGRYPASDYSSFCEICGYTRDWTLRKR